VDAYTSRSIDLGRVLYRGLALSLSVDESYFDTFYKDPMNILRMIHYPQQPANPLPNQKGCGAHTDFGGMTILAQDSSGGLELRSPQAELVLAPPRPHHFIVNAGDMLSAITADTIRSAPHRVINRAGIGRYSIPFFYDPDFDARFSTLPDFSAGEFLLAKFNKFYRHRKEVSEPTA